MGVVYKARHIKLNRIVALKMILSEQAGRGELMRFLAEAEAVAAIKHENVVQVFDYGEANGRPFMALEYLSGGKLTKLLPKEGKAPGSALSFRDAAQLLTRIARGVAAAHALGIVHRDLKPANVLLDESDVPKVADFGLAKRADQAAVTQTGQVVGTVAYMSPEQAKGESKFVGPQADVWALGVMLYEALTGARPFTGTVQEILAKIQNAEPAAPRQLAPTIPRDLELICLKCLAKEPHERYPTAKELADDLNRFLRGEPISVRPAGPVERAYKWVRRNRLASAAMVATATAAAVLVGLVIVLSDNTNLRDQTKGEISRREDADERRLKSAQEAAREAQLKKDAEVAAAREEMQKRDARYFAQLISAARIRKQDPLRAAKMLEDTAECPSELRELAWSILHRFCQRNYLTIPDLQAVSLAVSPDSKTLAIGTKGAKPALRLLDIETGRQVQEFTGLAGNVVGMAFLPDAQTLITASSDGAVRFWELKTGKVRRTIKASTAGLQGFAISPDGRWLATSDAGHAAAERPSPVKLWDLQGDGKPTELAGHKGLVYSLTFSSGGELLASSSADGTVRVWDVAEARSRATCQFKGWVSCVAFAPDGKSLAAGNMDGMVMVWDTHGKELRSWSGEAAGINWLAYSKDGSVLATAHQGGFMTKEVKLWNPQTGAGFLSLDGGNAEHERLAFAPNGKTLAACDKAGTVRLWRLSPSEENLVIPAHFVGYAVAFNPKGDAVASGGGLQQFLGEVLVWDSATGAGRRAIGRHKSKVLTLAYNPAGDTLAAGAADGSIKLLDPATGTERRTFAEHSQEVRCVTFSHSGRLVASGGLDRVVLVWDSETGAVRHRLEGHEKPVMGTAFSSDDAKLVTTGHDGTIRTWDLNDGKELSRWEDGPSGSAFCLALAPDGKTVFTGHNARILAWDTATGKVRYTGSGHTNWVFTLSLSPDGRTLASGSHDGTVKLWDAASLREVLSFSAGQVQIKCVAYSRDGKALAGIGTDGKLRIWR